MVTALGIKDFPKDLSSTLLDTYVGKKIEDICSMFGKTGDDQNHCAHFVSHVLGFRFGLMCNKMVWANRNDTEGGRTLRVNDIFNNCPERGYWKNKPANLDPCLIFAVLDSQLTINGELLVMADQPKKHVGIFHTGGAYNYGNTKDKVRRDGAAHFTNLYGKGTVALYARFPV